MEMKRFSFLGILLGVMTFAMSFVSCSEDNDGEVKAGLVGVWEYTYEVDKGEYLEKNIETYKFNSDNTGTHTETSIMMSNSGSSTSDFTLTNTEKFTYIYDEDDDHLILNFIEEGAYIQYNVMGISQRELMLEDKKGNVYIYLKK